MAATSAWQIILIFSVMFIAVTIAALWFAFKTTRLRSKKELQEKRMEIMDKHFNEMIRIECPYCKTSYAASGQECPDCELAPEKSFSQKCPYDARALFSLSIQ